MLTLPSLEVLVVLQGLKNLLKTKLVISPIVPMQIQNGVFRYSKETGSAAEEVASALSESRVVSAFHNLPAASLEEQDQSLDFDVLVACENREDYYQASRLIGSIEGLRPLYAGSLAMSRQVEALTPLLLNVGRMNGLRRLSFKFVS